MFYDYSINKVIQSIRRQLTLFIDKKDSVDIERIRQMYNPVQYNLIDSHVTLCREDEIEDIDSVLQQLQHLHAKPITVHFGKITRFPDGSGALLPSLHENKAFEHLRSLCHSGKPIRHHQPHITLMHPRNSFCDDDTFRKLQSVQLPSSFVFRTISLIEQRYEGKWQILEEFHLH